MLRLSASLLLAAAAGQAAAPKPQFSGSRILDDVRTLSSTEFEGRGPGTAGEDRTVEFLQRQFRVAGFEPGNPDGSFVQTVPLAGITSKTTAAFHVGGRDLEPSWINDYIAFSHRLTPTVSVQASDLIFCGYGVVAPEYHWDDFKGVDVRGKTIVVLVNDPQVPDPRDPSRLDPAMFRGSAMTYYGRWTYKYEEAAAKGAAGCLIVHETGPAGYPFAVVAASQGRENFDLQSANGNADQVPVAGWLTLDMAHRLFAAAGLDYGALKAAASRPDFHPVSLKGTADFTIRNAVRSVRSRNVVAKLTGADPALRNDVVVYSAHWDHLGRDTRLPGDPVYHGAADNGSGTAVLLEIARAFASRPRPARSLLFLVVTAEEKGLLGSRYYVQHPLVPLRRTVADLNLDIANFHGAARDLESVGYPSSSLETLAAALVAPEGRTVVPEWNAEAGFYFRSDHFEFAKAGVPSCLLRGGTRLVGHPDGEGMAEIEDYYSNHYHKVADVIDATWSADGLVQDASTLYALGAELAGQNIWPQWNAGNAFKARRDAMMAPP